MVIIPLVYYFRSEERLASARLPQKSLIESSAALVYVPGFVFPQPPPAGTPVASGEVMNTYTGLLPGSRVTVGLVIKSSIVNGGPIPCQTTSEILTVQTY